MVTGYVAYIGGTDVNVESFGVNNCCAAEGNREQ